MDALAGGGAMDSLPPLDDGDGVATVRLKPQALSTFSSKSVSESGGSCWITPPLPPGPPPMEQMEN